MSTARLLRATGASVGEGPLWDAERGVLWWVDIKGRRLHRTDPAHEAGDGVWSLPGQPGCLAACADGTLMLALQAGLARFDPDRVRLSAPLPFETDRAGNRSNDGKPGPDGAFWVGTMPDVWEGRASGGLWRIAPATAPRRVLDGIGCANALCWSPDRRTLYFADSRQRRVMAYGFDAATGALGPARTLLDLAATPLGLPEAAVPDGATVDATGRVWLAIWDGGCMLALSPEGQVTQRLDLPARRPTCPAFGGPGLATLFVTSARHGLDAPAAADGALLAVEGLGVCGLPEPVLAWPPEAPPRLPEAEVP